MNLKNITLEIVGVVKEVGQYIKTESRNFSKDDIEEKGLHDLVSYVDKEAENRIVKALSGLIPESGFIAEENQDLQTAKKYNWIIDPLDGTTNFIHGIPVFSISIALIESEQLVLGVVYEINNDECFYAWKDGDAFLNGKPITVSSTRNIEESLLATGFPYNDYSLMSPYLALLNDLMRCTRGIRRLGSAAVDLAYVACGRFDSFFEYNLNPWDVAAGAFILKQAGGLVSDFHNTDNYLFGRQIVASNNFVHKDIIRKIEIHFNVKI